MSDVKTLKEMSLEELELHGVQLRADLCELHAGERSDENNDKMRALLREREIYDAVYSLALQQAEREAARAAAEAAAQSLPPTGATGIHSPHGPQSIGELLFNAQAMQDWISHGLRAEGPNGGAFAFEVMGRTGYDLTNYVSGVRVVDEFGSGGPGNNSTGDTTALLPVGQPIPPVPRQARLAMRDLIPSTTTTLPRVPYVRELTPTANEGGASAVAEGGTKPDASLNFEGANADPTVIAVSLSPTKQLWEDAPLVVAYVNQRLPYLARFREDAEILNGSGTWPDIEGIRNVSGVQSQAATSGEFAITIGNAIADVENVDGSASGVVMNPTNAWNMFTKRAAGGSGTFDAGTPFSISSPNALTVWGLPTVRSRVYPAGEALVGDFARGAMIIDREGLNIQVYPQHSDYAIKNQILILCEERVGLAIWRPDFFVKATLS